MTAQMRIRATLELSGDRAVATADLLTDVASWMSEMQARYAGELRGVVEPSDLIRRTLAEASEYRRIGELAQAREQVVGLWEDRVDANSPPG